MSSEAEKVGQAPESEPPRYWAFISYSHRDEKVAAWLHRSIEHYRVPRYFLGRDAPGGRVPRRLFPVFRDREEMASSSSLTDEIHTALAESRNLIVVCTPHAAVSRWVNQEILTFQELGRKDRVFCLIADGEPNAANRPESGELECFPASLRSGAPSAAHGDPVEPIAADIRKRKDGKRNAKLKLVAGMLGVGLDDLKNRDRRRRRWQRTVQSLAAALVLCVILAIWFGVAKPERDLASARARASASELALSSDPARALALAIDAAQTARTVESERAIRRALNASHLRSVLVHDGHPSLRALSKHGERVATVGQGVSGVRVWDPGSGREIAVVRDIYGVGQIGISGDGKRLFIATYEGARIRDLASGRDVTLSSDDGRGPTMGVGEGVVVFDPGGDRLLTARYDSTVLWDADSGRPIADLDVTYVKSAAFSPDARRLITMTGGPGVELWDAMSGERITTLEGHEGSVAHAAFSSDGETIVTTVYGGSVRLWNGRSGSELRALRPREEDTLHAAFSPAGDRLVTSGRDNTAIILDLKDGTTTVLRGHQSWVLRAAFSPDGRTVLTVGEERSVRIWDARTGASLGVLAGHSKPIIHAVFSADGRRVITTSEDLTTRVWSTLGGEIATLVGHGASINRIAFSPTGKQVLTAGEDGTARLWDAESGEQVAAFPTGGEAVRRASFSPDGTRILTATPQSVSVWDRDSGSKLASLSKKEWLEVSHATFAPGGEQVVVTSYGGSATIWNWSGDRVPVELKVPYETVGNAVVHAAVSPDGETVVTTGTDGKARLWNAETGAQKAVLNCDPSGVAASPTATVRHAAFNARGSRVVVAGWDGTTRVFDVSSGEEFAIFKGHEDDVAHAVFAPDGSRIATAAWDRTARIWALPSEQTEAEATSIWSKPERPGVQLFALTDHNRPVRHVEFSSDGKLLLTAGGDGTARLWNAHTGASITVFAGHAGPVRDAAFAPDGSLVATASDDGTARLYLTRFDQLLELAAMRVPVTFGEHPD